MLQSLAYIIHYTPSLAGWHEFMTGQLALGEGEQIDANIQTYRMDSKAQRFIVEHSSEHVGLGLGFLVPHSDELASLISALGSAGITVYRATADELAVRKVSEMAWCEDPDGNRVEFAVNHADATTPFVGGRPIGGFRTGELGLGHVGLKAGKFAEMRHFYVDLLGFLMSDYSEAPLRVDFLHINPRHHTLGLADTPGTPGIYHIMVEYLEWDDLGRALDYALLQDDSIGVTLGRHTNDHMTSFYVKTPDGYMFELGWGGLLIEIGDWSVEKLPGLSLWGHERYWLPESKRAEARVMLQDLAAIGLRAPLHVPRESVSTG